MNRLEFQDLPNLPDEMWGKLFSYLPVVDRKSVRLCCRRFYEICNCQRMHADERIVFEDFNFCAAISSVSSSDRKAWNVELHRVLLDDDCDCCELFFRRQGPKVRSLTFDKCSKLCSEWGKVKSNVVASVITSCQYLREIHFAFDTSECSDRFHRHFVEGMKILNDFKVVRETVETFTLKVPKGSPQEYYFGLTNGEFLGIFDIFPNIKNLRLSIRVAESFDWSDTKLTDVGLVSDCITFPCIRSQLLKMRHQLVKLHLRFMNETSDYRRVARLWLQIGHIEANNLKELALNWNCIQDYSRVKPFRWLKRVTHFDCVLPMDHTSYSRFVQLLLKAAPNLQTLKVRMAHNFSMSAKCFRALVRSQLTTLSFHSHSPSYTNKYIYQVFPAKYALQGAFFSRSLSPNRTLRRLKMNARDSQVWRLFSRYFTNLENFVGQDIGVRMLLGIFQNLPKLSNLVLDDGYKSPVHDGLQMIPLEYSDPLSSHWLDNLTHLQITERSSVVSKFLLAKFKFPKLKSLKIEYRGWASVEDDINYLNALLPTIGKLSQLESLYIRCGSNVESSFQQWLDLFNALPKLRSALVAVDDFQVLADEQYRYLFQVCPSLRVICVPQLWADTVYYLKDIVRNTVERRRNAIIRSIDSLF